MFDHTLASDLPTAIDKDPVHNLQNGVYGDWVPSIEVQKGKKPKKVGLMNAIEFFLLYPLVAGYIADPKDHSQVIIIIPDKYIQGTSAQRGDVEMQEKVSVTLKPLGREKNISTTAYERLRSFASKTGMNAFEYPIIMDGDKVMEIAKYELNEGNYETRGRFGRTRGNVRAN